VNSGVGDVFSLLPATLYRAVRSQGRGQYLPGNALNADIQAARGFSYSNLFSGAANFSVVE
jgi:hypothetical protein